MFQITSSRSQESSMLALASELHNLHYLLEERNLEHQLMLVAKWEDPYFLIEVSIFTIDGLNEDMREETESELNYSFIMADGEDLDNLLDSVLDMMPSLDVISSDSNFDIRAHTGKLFQQLQDQIKGSLGLLRLGMDVMFTEDHIALNRWSAFAVEGSGGFSIIEEHKLFHSFEREVLNEEDPVKEGDD